LTFLQGYVLYVGTVLQNTIQAETPPDRFGLFLCPNSSGQRAQYFAGCGRNVQGASLKATSGACSRFEHPAFSILGDASEPSKVLQEYPMPAKVTPFPSAQSTAPSPATTKRKTYKRSAANMLREHLRMVRSAYDLLIDTPPAHQRGLSNHILMRMEMDMDYLISKIMDQRVWVEIPADMLRPEQGVHNGN
jgi:hypothetical protein